MLMGKLIWVLSQTAIFASPILDDLVDSPHFWLILGAAGGQISNKLIIYKEALV